jgi:peptidyl-prolyl cis-trans isomerase C
MLTILNKLIREPLVQFLVIGACIYAAYGLFRPSEENVDEKVLYVSAGRINGFVGQWKDRWKRPPTRAELDGIIASYVREEILYRQAIAIGLSKDDPITRRRLAQKLEFLTSNIALSIEPKVGELENYFAENRDAYRKMDVVTFSQVFLDPHKRKDAILGDAERLLKELQAAGAPEARSLTVGDSFMIPNYISQATEQEVRKQMGPRFTKAVMDLSPGLWHGPVKSDFGVHLVYVYELQQASLPKFSDVQERVRQDWQERQQKKFNDKFFENLKQDYAVNIAEVLDSSLLNVDGKVKQTEKSKPVAGDSQ